MVHRLMPVMTNFAKITLSLFLILLCLPLSRQGMFVDGVWYAAIAKNMAAGLGSVWDPALSKTMFLHFREHPSLAIAMQSTFFHLFGDAFWVERLYCFLIAICQIAVVYKLWANNLLSKKERACTASFWWLLFLWLMIPINIGMYKNNLLEASLTLFSSLACLALIRSFKSTRAFIGASIFSSICLILGFMCNGPSVLFPLAILFLYGWLIDRQSMQLLVMRTALLCMIAGFCFLLFFIAFPDALLNLKGYFYIQLMAAITGQRDLSFTGWKHFYIVYIYLKDYIFLFLIGIGAIALQARLNQQSVFKHLKLAYKKPWFQFYFLLSLCASLPVGISHRQMFHYISASSPVILLAIMHLTYPSLVAFKTYVKGRAATVASKNFSRILSVLLLASVLGVISQFGGYNKNQQLIEEVKKVANFLPKEQVVKGSPQVMTNFDIPANFARYSLVSFIALDTENAQLTSQYYIYYPGESLLKGYEPVEMGLKFFHLAHMTRGKT